MKTLTAPDPYEALRTADLVVFDVPCDYAKKALGDLRNGTVEIRELEQALEGIGEKVGRPKTLVLIRTTVGPVTTEQAAYPIIRKASAGKGLRRSLFSPVVTSA